jgi:hypothetical protein
MEEVSIKKSKKGEKKQTDEDEMNDEGEFVAEKKSKNADFK